MKRRGFLAALAIANPGLAGLATASDYFPKAKPKPKPKIVITNNNGMVFNCEGTKLYIAQGESVVAYSLGSAWDLTKAKPLASYPAPPRQQPHKPQP